MENHSGRLVLVPSPFQGHITPMLQLASTLRLKGFSITVAHTHFNFPDPSNHPHFEFVPILDGLSDHAHISSQNFIAIASTLNTNCVSSLREFLIQITKENVEHERIRCIIYDGLMYFADAVAKQLGIPTIVFRTTSATNLLTYHAFARLRSNGYLPLQDSRSFDQLMPELDPLRFKDLPIFNLPNSDAMLQQIEKSLEVRSSGVIMNTVDCLEGSSSLGELRKLYEVPFFFVGPLHKMAPDSRVSFFKEDNRCMCWLNKQASKSVLYISLGSIACWNEKELTEMAWGLVNSKQPFLWVIRAMPFNINGSGSDWVESLPEDLKEAMGERGCIVKWAPQKEVLAHRAVGGFWSHCGWNSSLESLCEGMPIICQPYFGDQRVNARLLSHVWRVGLEWSNVIERGEIERAVTRMMVDEQGREMRLRAVELKDKIRLSVEEGGSSFKALNDLQHFINTLSL
ncbi:hypothetical protein L6164_021823 [Bauhinia variegata]|uniref:Uncharacterized protein n=1 Tax=Bauhinia variegata TaxID=167791 RepID=A0ACB9MDN3_BAUVA|nr:hypothetical protein L6164_021823 [Bauhinia variegata]